MNQLNLIFVAKIKTMKSKILTLFILSTVYSMSYAQGYLSENSFDFGKIVNPDLLSIPNPSEVLDKALVAKTLDIKPEMLTSKESKSIGNQNIKSSFYAINDGEATINGMIFQISTNPVYIEAPTFISFTLDSKLEQGESLSDSDRKIAYKEGHVGKVRFVYSYEIGRIYWNIGDNYLMMLGFNDTIETEEQLESVAKAMIPNINKNLIGWLLK